MVMTTQSYAEDEKLFVSGMNPDTGQICSSPQTHSPGSQRYSLYDTRVFNPQPQPPSAFTVTAFSAPFSSVPSS